MRSYVLWICDRCGDHAEVEPGGICEVCLEGTVRVVDVVPEAELAAERAHADRLAEAIRLTQEYVGPRVLPPIGGWSWFDAMQAHQARRSTPATTPTPDSEGGSS